MDIQHHLVIHKSLVVLILLFGKRIKRKEFKVMEIIKATTMGYCMGVRRAMELAEKAVKDYTNKKIFTLGPLIHNQVALDSLFKKGIEVLYQDKIELLCNENTVVIIRAHGVPPKTLDLLEKTKTVII